MKNLGYMILGCVIGALITYKFLPQNIQTNAANSLIPKKEVTRPDIVISIAEADSLSSRWTEYRQGSVDSAYYRQRKGKGKYKNKNFDHKMRKDTRNVWWSLEDIQDYIAYAQQESTSLGYTMDGIRVYLGVYGDNEDVVKKDRTTMFMVPTGTKNVSKGSSLNIASLTQRNSDDVPGGSPGNKGTGGQGAYPWLVIING